MSRLARYILTITACMALLAGCTGLTGKLERGAQGDVSQADALLGKLADGP
ncbi:MAG: hypothetical protein WDN30_04630 [Pararobbsia sp.]